MRRWAAVFAAGVLLMTGCGAESVTTMAGEEAATTTTAKATTTTRKATTTTFRPAIESFTKENWALLDTSPDKYKSATVDIVGQVFSAPQVYESGIAWQMWADPKNSEWNTIVISFEPGVEVNEGDYVRVQGVVEGTLEYENVMGGSISAPQILAGIVEIVDATALASPPLRSVELGKAITQHALTMTVAKVEFAEDETRVFIQVVNNSAKEASFYDFNAKAVQGKKQFEAEQSYSTDYPEVQSELLPGIESSGVVAFPPMDPKVDSKFLFEGRVDDYSLDFVPFVFTVSAE